MHAWLPSTWPEHNAVDAAFIATLKAIFQDSMLFEIRNVVDDAHARNGDLRHRGHVVAVALMCALDAISCYGYRVCVRTGVDASRILQRRGDAMAKFLDYNPEQAYLLPPSVSDV
ncbi:MAG: hypothetical protein WAN14_09410, partial [Candidatus Acidiferrales bacterium]